MDLQVVVFLDLNGREVQWLQTVLFIALHILLKQFWLSTQRIVRLGKFPLQYLAVGQVSGGGAVLAHNGKIYFIPARHGYILEFDPTTETCQTWGDDLGSTSNNKWRGGILAPNGKIYCIPSYSSSVLAIDLGLGPVNGKTWTVSGLPNNRLDPLSPLFNNC